MDSSKETIIGRALKFSQNVDLMYMHCREEFVDLDLDIDIDIDKSLKLHIAMNIDTRALKFSQNVDLMYMQCRNELGDLHLHKLQVNLTSRLNI